MAQNPHESFSDGGPSEAQTRVRMDRAQYRAREQLDASALECKPLDEVAGFRKERPRDALHRSRARTEYGWLLDRQTPNQRVGVVVAVSALGEYQLQSFRLRLFGRTRGLGP